MSKLYLFYTMLLITVFSSAYALEVEKRALILMGSGFEITAVATSKATAIKAVDAGIAEIKRIEQLISEWDSTSRVSEINRMAGIRPVKAEAELFSLLQRSLSVSRLTNGAFDISFASMDKLWKFDRSEQQMPDSNRVARAASKINWQKIKLNSDEQTVLLEENGMKIGFGGIGKGYAANKAKQIMQTIEGVKGGIVNASGDLTAWGESNHADGWSVQIAHPDTKKKALGWIRLNNMSIVTSGDYEKYFSCNGVRYSHIIDPRTGYPTTGIKSVTLICPDAELADALATSVAVLGIEDGLYLVNQLNQVECLIVDQHNKLHASDNMHLNYYETNL